MKGMKHQDARRFALFASISRLLFLAPAAITSLNAEPVADTAFRPRIENPAYSPGSGPVVLIDEAHFNWHTSTGRYLPFAEWLRRDGYVVQASKSPFEKESLKGGRILVIANAVNERNKEDWSPPNPSAFTEKEIRAVRTWVKGGGSLLLIADHRPWPGAADKLASAFGVHFSNGFALPEKTQEEPLIFRRSDGALAEHAITKGQATNERVDSVATFTGSAFRADKGGQPLLIFGSNIVSFLPVTSSDTNAATPRIAVKGWYQGATMRLGNGRVAVFGEAAMFSAQVEGSNREPFGMNAPTAKQNAQFVLNVLHWLAGRLDK